LPEAPPIRSYLYAPGSNPRVMDKALGAGADAVILDLEDSVATEDKPAARRAISYSDNFAFRRRDAWTH